MTEGKKQNSRANPTENSIRSDNKFEAILKNDIIGILYLYGNREIVLSNDRMTEILGYTPEELKGKSIETIHVDHDHFTEFGERYYKKLKVKEIAIKWPFRHKNGKIVQCRITGRVLNQKNINDGIIWLFEDITKEIEADMELKNREERFSKLINNSIEGVFVIEKGKFVFANPVIFRISGYDQEELFKRDFLEFIHEDDRKMVIDRNIRRLKGEIFPPYDFRFLNKNGEIRWVTLNATIINWKGNKAVLCFINEITARKKIEFELCRNEEKFRSIFENSPQGIFYFNNKGVILECNDKFVEIIGSSRKSLIGLKMFTQLNDQRVVEQIKESLSSGEGFFEGYYTSVTGKKTTPVRCVFKGIENDKNIISSGIGIIENITYRMQSEKELRESENLFRILFNNITDPIMLFDGNTLKPRLYNKAAIEKYKYKEDEFKLLTVNDLNYAVEKDKISLRREHLEQKGHHVFETIHIDKSGKSFPVEVSASLANHSGKPILLAVIRDITEKKIVEEKTEQHLRELSFLSDSSSHLLKITSLEELHQFMGNKLAEIVPDSIILILAYDESTKLMELRSYTGMQDTAENIIKQIDKDPVGLKFGVSQEGLNLIKEQKVYEIRKSLKELSDSSLPGNIIDKIVSFIGLTGIHLMGIMHKGLILGEVVVLHSNKSQIANKNLFETFINQAAIAWQKIKAENNLKLKSLVVEQQNIKLQDANTKMKLINEELTIAKERAEESDQMKSVFLAQMSHELRTPLNAIIGFGELLSEKPEDEESSKFGKIIHKQGSHLLEIIESIFDITLLETKESKVVYSEFNINDLFDELRYVFDQNRKLRNKMHISLNLYPDPNFLSPVIRSDINKLKQFLINIVDNSLKYTQKGSIEYGYKLIKNDIEFYVKDTGIGIPGPELEKVFDLFRQVDDSYNKKESGVGLGLSICKKIAELLGGKIDLISRQGEGTKITLLLKDVVIKPEDAPEKQTKNKQNTQSYNNKKILVAEDESSNFQLISAFLKKTGAEIIWAKNGNEALKIASSYDNSLSLILMDIKMPELNGEEAMQRIKKTNPEIIIIAVTAYALPSDMERLLKIGFDDYISKPLRKSKFEKIISKYLN